MLQPSVVVGTPVQYYSGTYQQWIDCSVVNVGGSGEVQISCKPGYWMSPAEQTLKLRWRWQSGNGTASASTAGSPKVSRQGSATAATPVAAPAAQLPAQRSDIRRSTYSEEIRPEQREMIRRILTSRETASERARYEFNRFDTNHDNVLQSDELHACLLELSKELGIPAPQSSHMQMLMKKFDADGDGVLDFNEFEEFFYRMLLRSRQSFVQWKVHCEFFVEKQAGDPWKVYEAIKKLGEGTFGITHLVRDTRNQQLRVLKTVNKAKAHMPPEELEQEIKNLKTLDHPHIIKFFEYYEDSKNIYLVMEEARGGELLKVISEHHKSGWRVSERWASIVMEQVLSAIAYCHGRRLIHKDLKAENIMLLRIADSRTSPHAVVIDLGLAEMFSAGVAEEPCEQQPALLRAARSQDDIDNVLYKRIRSRKIGGTPTTMAPEVWLAYQGKGSFGMKCDVYSLGVVLFQLLTGQLPFVVQSLRPADWLEQIERGPPLAAMSHCSNSARDLVCRMLAPEASRPTAREALRHEWFTSKSQHVVPQLSEKQMAALCDFATKNEFQKAIMLQAASQIRAADLPKINAIFRMYDRDNTGYLEGEELVGALKEMGIEEHTARRAAKHIDLDKNGKIEYTEFVAACISMCEDQLENYLWQIFRKLDKDGSGTLTPREIEQLLLDGELRGLGFAPSGTEIQQIIQGLDKEGAGCIRFEDFRDYINPRSGRDRRVAPSGASGGSPPSPHNMAPPSPLGTAPPTPYGVVHPHGASPMHSSHGGFSHTPSHGTRLR